MATRECQTCGRPLGPNAVRGRFCGRSCAATYGHPTRSEIAAATVAIRATWDAQTEQSRRGYRPVPWTAPTMRQMDLVGNDL